MLQGGRDCTSSAGSWRRRHRPDDERRNAVRDAADVPSACPATKSISIFSKAPHSGSDFEGAFDHILVAQSIDLFLVAPATADCIARLAAGIADDFLTTFHLAVTAPVVIAPAMNTRMWEHASVQANLQTLRSRGVQVIDPEVGQMACRTYGPGRLAPVEEIVEYVMRILNRVRDLEGRKVLVTAGPTVEDIDPVRYISNRSSGKMGYAIAQAARNRGANVVLVSGPTELRLSMTSFASAPPKKCGAPCSIMPAMPTW